MTTCEDVIDAILADGTKRVRFENGVVIIEEKEVEK
jgi:hypothetical protein